MAMSIAQAEHKVAAASANTMWAQLELDKGSTPERRKSLRIMEQREKLARRRLRELKRR